jgi:TRAP transporter TAXI family solute receptor
MIRAIQTGMIASVALFLGVASAMADFADKKPISYSVDGATATGYLKVVTESLNGIVREAYPGSDATYKPGSPAGGILNISTGKSEFTFNAAPAEISYAHEGKAPFKESLKGKFKFVMMLHNDLVIHNIMTKEWADKNGITSFEDIARKQPVMRLAVNQPANLQSTVTMYQNLFTTFGIDEKQVTNNGAGVIRANSATGLDALRDGKIDVFINGGFVPTAEITDVSRGRELVWISGSQEKMQEAAKKWGISVYKVPKDAYPFMTKDEYTNTIWNAIVAGASVPEETVYKFTKALFENQARVRAIHPTLSQFSPQNNSRNVTPMDIHPGAARYFREVGLLK